MYPPEDPQQIILQATSKPPESSLDESVTFLNLCGAKAEDKSIRCSDNDAGLIVLYAQGENFLSDLQCLVLLCMLLHGRRSLGLVVLAACPVDIQNPQLNEARTAIPTIPRFCSKSSVSIHLVVNSIATQTHFANHRRVFCALRLLVVFPEACLSSGRA